jgi:hypothetical protein
MGGEGRGFKQRRQPGDASKIQLGLTGIDEI